MDIVKINGDLLGKFFVQGTLTLTKEKELINSLNVFPVPDGDTGTNMSLTLKTASELVSSMEGKSASEVARTMAKGSLMGARGNSGVILSQIFRGFSKGIEDKEELTVEDFANALSSASSVAYKAVMKPVEGTILTVIRETAEYASELDKEGMVFHDFLKLILDRALLSLDDTPNHLAVLKQAGVVDAGGRGLVSILKGFYNTIIGEEIEDVIEEHKLPGHREMELAPEDIKFRYCTEFIIKDADGDADNLRKEIYELGDSMVFVQDDDLIKVHIHTNNPGVALEKAIAYGELLNIKIDNMKNQHETILTEEVKEKKQFGFVSVGMGEGFTDIFKSFGVDEIIEGGQTMNPSTEDLMKAVEKINADTIFILPNNSNIILAANQTAELSDKDVVVIPSKTIPQGINALVNFEMSSERDENIESMSVALGEVSTLQVTYAVRDTEMNGFEIKEKDILAIYNGEITAVTTNVNHAIIEVVEKAVEEDDAEIVTLYYGSDIEEENVKELVAELEEKFEDVEFDFYYGGQPIYYYIISLE